MKTTHLLRQSMVYYRARKKNFHIVFIDLKSHTTSYQEEYSCRKCLKRIFMWNTYSIRYLSRTEENIRAFEGTINDLSITIGLHLLKPFSCFCDPRWDSFVLRTHALVHVVWEEVNDDFE